MTDRFDLKVGDPVQWVPPDFLRDAQIEPCYGTVVGWAITPAGSWVTVEHGPEFWAGPFTYRAERWRRCSHG